MALPFFYIDTFVSGSSILDLNEDTSKHIVQVLRMQPGELLHLTDGMGQLHTAEFTAAHKKKALVKIRASESKAPPPQKVTIAISLVKNASRFEWFLEKATELGVTEIIPLLCERTERQHFRYERMKGVMISAMLQSQQCWLPKLWEPEKFENLPLWPIKSDRKFIAHCIDEGRQPIADIQINHSSHVVILIGPEGDFSPDEIQLALFNQYTAVTLGETRLRTETAGMAAAVLLRIR